MRVTLIHTWINVAGWIAAICAFGLIIAMVGNNRTKWMLRAWEGIREGVQKGRFWDMSKTSRFLEQMGAKYHLGTKMEPLRYVVLRFALFGAGMLMGSSLGLMYILPAGMLFGIMPRMYLLFANRKDNEKLLPELKLVYHALAMEIRAGVYVTDALTECYGSVREVRLRDALLALSGDLVMKADFGDALERFQRKFNNRYVDSLCITLLQAQESGQAVELLTDIAEQIKDMESSLMARRKSGLDRSVTFYQLGIFAIILGIVLYACVTHMFAEVVLF
jgi:Flp pilus assembly protein TadB